MKKINTAKSPMPSRLSLESKKQVKELMKLGVPKSLAAVLSAQKSPPKGFVSSLRRGQNYRRGNSKKRSSSNKRYNLQGGDTSIGFGGNSKSNNSRDQKYKIPSRSTASSGKIQKFAEKARSQASIINKPNASIFKIISIRYQKTKSRRLE